jgi:hypothetical protein
MADDTTPCPPGKARKDAALTLHEQHRAYAILCGRRAMLTTLLAGAECVTADTVRDAVTLPDGVDPVCLGAVPGPLARAKIIARDGYQETARAAGHARPIARWRLVDRAAAEQWLAANPVLAAPPPTSTQGSLFGDDPPKLPD